MNKLSNATLLNSILSVMESSDRLTSYITPEGYVWDVGLSP